MASTAPDVVLLDHRLPDGDGVATIADLRGIRPSAKIVVLTATASDRVLVAAMEGGAAGFIAKTQRLDDVIAGVRGAAQGESVVSAKLLTRLLPACTGRAAAVGRSSPNGSARSSTCWRPGCPTPTSPNG